jgi:hypothetical protein
VHGSRAPHPCLRLRRTVKAAPGKSREPHCYLLISFQPALLKSQIDGDNVRHRHLILRGASHPPDYELQGDISSVICSLSLRQAALTGSFPPASGRCRLRRLGCRESSGHREKPSDRRRRFVQLSAFHFALIAVAGNHPSPSRGVDARHQQSAGFHKLALKLPFPSSAWLPHHITMACSDGLLR